MGNENTNETLVTIDKQTLEVLRNKSLAYDLIIRISQQQLRHQTEMQALELQLKDIQANLNRAVSTEAKNST